MPDLMMDDFITAGKIIGRALFTGIAAVVRFSVELYTTWSDSDKVRVTRVVDGDGVTAVYVNTNQELNIRLIGIDAPELNQPFGYEAKRYLEILLLNDIAILTEYSKDQYGRVLGNLKVPGKVENVSLEMLKMGLAHVYTGRGAEYGEKREEFFAAEIRAKNQRKGLWSQNKVVSPMQFKRTRTRQRTV